MVWLSTFDVQPDIVTTAKGLAAGYAAISVTITSEAIFDRFKQDPLILIAISEIYQLLVDVLLVQLQP